MSTITPVKTQNTSKTHRVAPVWLFAALAIVGFVVAVTGFALMNEGAEFLAVGAAGTVLLALTGLEVSKRLKVKNTK